MATKSSESLYDSLGLEHPSQTTPPLESQLHQKEVSYTDVSNNESVGESEHVETAFNLHEVQELAKTDLDFLAALATPETFKYRFPPVYQAVWQWLLTYVHKTRDFSQLALGLPRGFAKTSVVKLFLLYCILFTTRKFIAVTAENTAKAINIVSDVMDMLSEPNVVKTFGDWRVGVQTDQQVLKKFGFRGRNITILAGTVETIRGINLKNARPDVMIFDDV